MVGSVHVDRLVLTPGSRFGLSAATASCRWTFQRAIGLSEPEIEQLRGEVQGLWPARPIFGVEPGDWPAAFLARSADERLLATWGVALTVAIQLLARDAVDRGAVLTAEAQAAQVALPWRRRAVLAGALKFGLRFLLLTLSAQDQASGERGRFQSEFEAWLGDVQTGGLPPNALRFAMAAHRRSIPVAARPHLLQLGWGAQMQHLDGSFTGRTSNLAARMARNKFVTNQLLRAARLPVPDSVLVKDADTALRAASQLGWPVVVKPADLDLGLGVEIEIRTEQRLRCAHDAAAQLTKSGVIVEKHVEGADHRMLVVDGRLIATARRTPGGVVGDGSSTIEQLVAKVNADPRRGEHKFDLLRRLKLDESALGLLQEHGLRTDSVPEAGRFVRLVRTGNIAAGGTASPAPRVHRDNVVAVERAARIIGLDIAGVDFLCPDISRSWREVGGAICEVNGQPAFRAHWLAEPVRDINGEVLDWLFGGRPSRIPVAAVIGSPATAAVAARCLHRIWLRAGRRAGLASSSGIWIGEDFVGSGEDAGSSDARVLLDEPGVEAAVFELSPLTLAHAGHPCDRYEAVAWLDSSHAEVVGGELLNFDLQAVLRSSGAAGLSARRADCRAAAAVAKRAIVYSADGSEDVFREQLGRGGPAACIRGHEGQAWIMVGDGGRLHPLAPVPDQLSEDEESAVLVGAALAWALGLSSAAIASGLK